MARILAMVHAVFDQIASSTIVRVSPSSLKCSCHHASCVELGIPGEVVLGRDESVCHCHATQVKVDHGSEVFDKKSLS